MSMPLHALPTRIVTAIQVCLNGPRAAFAIPFMATNTGDRTSTYDVFFWCGVALVVIVTGAMLGKWAAARLRRPDEPYTGPPSGFDLADLRTLHEAGQLSDQEYERACRLVNARTLAASPDHHDAPPPGSENTPDPR